MARKSTRDFAKQSDPAHNPQFKRRWIEPEQRKPKKRQAPKIRGIRF